MRSPLWHLQIERTTNAPFEVVVKALMDRDQRPLWHPRPGAGQWKILEQSEDHLAMEALENPIWGVEEQALYRVEPHDDRLLLSYHARFKGWPVLLLMGYWRLRSHRIWERFVESL
ncbi:hypothetical protein [Holophaga foetida]|uniref:hypothetical protein n=1 Tax=Holophaga foetida TaxID=35839 RepID=UPI0002474D00|nr:hypothetical protein [Holophaga foetida]